VKWRGISIGKEPSLTRRDCFSLSTRHDLVISGKKIIGSAQRKDGASFLQHGSLLIDIQKQYWENIFLHRPDFTKIICLSEILNQVPDFETLAALLTKGFEEFFEYPFERFEFSPQDIENAKKIERNFLLI
ncbi:MAG TPA: hypothetical protein PKX05_03225, partial [bacterium]|nr:hypothetical protein [bacterium]